MKSKQMKKLLLVCAAQMFSYGLMAQDSTKNVLLYSVQMNWAPRVNNSISVEVGTWGHKRSFSITYDFKGESVSFASQWIGFKEQFVLYDKSKSKYTAYFSPKTCINSGRGYALENKELIDFGLISYYEITKNINFTAGVSNRYYDNKNSYNIFCNAGFTFLFFK